ncbi:MAG: DUF1292 domain-containing protein [Parasporobacterium sp.]|nr:DUF1292 domain-containing protein [Parasporobacterium sp.]
MADHEHGPECGCGCEEEFPVITLEFDDGENVECEPLFVFDYEGKDYIALVPVDEESEEVFIYEYNELGEDEFEFLDIEDDELFDKVTAHFESILEEAEAAEEE